MTNIPLIQGNSVQEINTSIIAIKKAQKELESLNTLIDNKIKALNLALSGGPGKYIESIQEVQGLIKVTEGSITDTIASGNSQPATSNGVAGAIGKIEVKNADLNILYPSVNGKVEYYCGRFTNAPRTRNTSIVRIERIKNSSTDEVQLYQEWISYGDSVDGYIPDKFYRFGYFTGNDTPTWTNWQKIVTSKQLNEFIKYKEVSISSITFTANGYVDISSYKPNDMNNFLFAILYNYGNVTSKDAIGVIGAGIYLFGTANATVTNVKIRYYYF